MLFSGAESPVARPARIGGVPLACPCVLLRSPRGGQPALKGYSDAVATRTEKCCTPLQDTPFHPWVAIVTQGYTVGIEGSVAGIAL